MYTVAWSFPAGNFTVSTGNLDWLLWISIFKSLVLFYHKQIFEKAKKKQLILDILLHNFPFYPSSDKRQNNLSFSWFRLGAQWNRTKFKFISSEICLKLKMKARNEKFLIFEIDFAYDATWEMRQKRRKVNLKLLETDKKELWNKGIINLIRFLNDRNFPLRSETWRKKKEIRSHENLITPSKGAEFSKINHLLSPYDGKSSEFNSDSFFF